MDYYIISLLFAIGTTDFDFRTNLGSQSHSLSCFCLCNSNVRNIYCTKFMVLKEEFFQRLYDVEVDFFYPSVNVDFIFCRNSVSSHTYLTIFCMEAFLLTLCKLRIRFFYVYLFIKY